MRDLNQTRDFFIDCLGWKQVGEQPNYPAVFVSDGHLLVTLWQLKNEEKPVEFDRRSNIGLHHLALRVESEEALNEIAERIGKWPGTRIEFALELLAKGPKRWCMSRAASGSNLLTCLRRRSEALRVAAR